MRSIKNVVSEFQADVAGHAARIRLDSGLYRHVSYARPGTSVHSFSIATFPGRLVYTGDMGSYVFSRLEDMFQFFRQDRGPDLSERINPSYWAEKIVATDIHSPAMEFSAETFRRAVHEWVEEYIGGREGRGWIDADRLRAEVKESILDEDVQDEAQAMQLIHQFEFRSDVGGPDQFGFKQTRAHHDVFQDFWEVNLREFSYRYLWACCAIVWGIDQYDEHTMVVGQ